MIDTATKFNVKNHWTCRYQQNSIWGFCKETMADRVKACQDLKILSLEIYSIMLGKTFGKIRIDTILYFTAYICRQLVYKGMRFFFFILNIISEIYWNYCAKEFVMPYRLQGRGFVWLPKSPRLRVVFWCQTLHRCAYHLFKAHNF